MSTDRFKSTVLSKHLSRKAWAKCAPNVSSALPRTICSTSALKQLLTVVRGHFGRKTCTVSLLHLRSFT